MPRDCEQLDGIETFPSTLRSSAAGRSQSRSCQTRTKCRAAANAKLRGWSMISTGCPRRMSGSSPISSMVRIARGCSTPIPRRRSRFQSVQNARTHCWAIGRRPRRSFSGQLRHPEPLGQSPQPKLPNLSCTETATGPFHWGRGHGSRKSLPIYFAATRHGQSSLQSRGEPSLRFHRRHARAEETKAMIQTRELPF